MQDRFKFRFWDKETQTMQKIPMVELRHRITLDKIFADDRVIFMQCTGLKDKNGKLIYEGDIINIWCINFTKNQISEVKFCKERAAFTFDYNTDFGNIVPCTMEKTEIEVIGNIYENSELIGGE